MREVLIFFAVSIVTASLVLRYWKAILTFLAVTCLALIFIGVLSLLVDSGALGAHHG